jgi:hypothetical protein
MVSAAPNRHRGDPGINLGDAGSRTENLGSKAKNRALLPVRRLNLLRACRPRTAALLREAFSFSGKAFRRRRQERIRKPDTEEQC